MGGGAGSGGAGGGGEGGGSCPACRVPGNHIPCIAAAAGHRTHGTKPHTGPLQGGKTPPLILICQHDTTRDTSSKPAL